MVAGTVAETVVSKHKGIYLYKILTDGLLCVLLFTIKPKMLFRHKTKNNILNVITLRGGMNSHLLGHFLSTQMLKLLYTVNASDCSMMG